jgi:hypothetical protein
MSDPFHKDNQWLGAEGDKYLAAYVVYLYGREALIRIEATVPVRFCIRVKDEDLIIVRAEAASPETTICFAPFCESLGWLCSKISLASKQGSWNNNNTDNRVKRRKK